MVVNTVEIPAWRYSSGRMATLRDTRLRVTPMTPNLSAVNRILMYFVADTKIINKKVGTMNYSVILVGIGIICLMAIASSGCLGTTPGGPQPVQTPPPAPHATPVQVGHLVVSEEQNKATVNLGLNNTITLKLIENPTTGFQWNLTTSPGLVIIADNYQSSAPQLTGSGGVHTWDMKAVQTGTQGIKATYMRSWEPVTGNETTFTMTVIVPNT